MSVANKWNVLLPKLERATAPCVIEYRVRCGVPTQWGLVAHVCVCDLIFLAVSTPKVLHQSIACAKAYYQIKPTKKHIKINVWKGRRFTQTSMVHPSMQHCIRPSFPQPNDLANHLIQHLTTGLPPWFHYVIVSINIYAVTSNKWTVREQWTRRNVTLQWHHNERDGVSNH